MSVISSDKNIIIEEVESFLPGAKKLIMNMGPQHPSTHGVLRVILELDGEKVIASDMDIGYLHRGIEKIAENITYTQFIPYTDRLDYLAAFSNNLGYVLTVEKLMGLEIPERVKYIRILMTELNRISSHLLWLGTQAVDLGATTPFLWSFTDRERIYDLFEMVCGARMTVNYFRIGGVAMDLPPGFLDKLSEFTKYFPQRVADYEALLSENQIWLARTKNVGFITPENAVNFALSGPTLRASGIKWDIRKSEPYSGYEKMDFTVPVGTNGDVYDRYLLRIEEMRQSNYILEQAIAQIPAGEIKAKMPRVIKPPPGEAYVPIEAPRGELGFYIVSDGSDKPYRLKIRAPSFVNLQALPVMIEGKLLPDVIAAIGGIDIVLGEIDR